LYNLPVQFLCVFVAFILGLQVPAFIADPPHTCDDCATWNKPREPFKVYGNTYYVGTDGLSALLVTSDAGHVLLDGGLSQSAPLIVDNVRKLGFAPEDIEWILVSHGHFDHAGGVRAIQRFTGARVAASASTAEALRRGENTPDDPQFGFGRAFNGFPAVNDVQVLADQQVVTVAGTAITAHMIPGHAPGSTAYTWVSCEGSTCQSMVYADSLTPAAAPGFTYGARLESLRRSIEKVAALPCDIVLAPHPQSTHVDQKLRRRAEQKGRGPDPFSDPAGCRAYAAAAMKALETRRAAESKS
jgi:metallo-beta-lactamase class B